MTAFITVAAILSALAGLADVGQAQTLAALPSATSLAGTGRISPTPVAVDFCRRFPAECAIDPAEPAVVALSPRVWGALVAVNREVNERVRPMADQEHWGLVDRWDFPDDGYGDCEDYQLLKRRLLAERGLPRRAMRMTVVLDENRAGHAVLMVRTDRGDFILDNQRATVLPWKETGYVFVKREGQASRAWVSLETDASPVATATSDED
jgi:predicted transglutaminase-like cysteine proteinase